MTTENNLYTTEELKEVPFPDCVEKCGTCNILGVSECENILFCQWKFDDTNR